jgi:hypothetical protein
MGSVITMLALYTGGRPKSSGPFIFAVLLALGFIVPPNIRVAHSELVEAMLELLDRSPLRPYTLDSAAKLRKYSSFIWSRVKEAYGSFQTCGICGDWIRRICPKGDLARLPA